MKNIERVANSFIQINNMRVKVSNIYKAEYIAYSGAVFKIIDCKVSKYGTKRENKYGNHRNKAFKRLFGQLIKSH